jgi:thiol:disulfide interchange protein
MLNSVKSASRLFLSSTVLLVLAFPCKAQSADDVVQWSAKVNPGTVQLGDRLEMAVTAKIADGWHVYSIDQTTGGPKATAIRVPDGPIFQPRGPVTGPLPRTAFDPNFQMETRFYESSATFKVPLAVTAKAPVGAQKAQVSVLFQVCNEQSCLPPTKTMVEAVAIIIRTKLSKGHSFPGQLSETGSSKEAAIGNADGPAVSANDNGANHAQSQPVGPAADGHKATSVYSRPPNSVLPAQEKSLGAFILLGLGMGALSLLTPCVFPMIPITVSYFTNHASGERKSAIFTAMIFAIGIILTFTAFGMLLAVIFGAGGVNQLAANPWVNLLITAIFLGFAFSLFGAYFIQVPASVVDKLHTIMRNKEGNQVVGALLMGFTFTLTSFTCTSPFVGTLLVMTAQGNWRWPLAGMLAFSTVFAIPFFLLALAPQLISQLPKAGGWMNSVKVVMGFLEIAAAMKFLSNADLVWHWGIFTRQVVLAVWVGIGMLTVLYVLGYFRMAHDSPIESVSATRMTVTLVFLVVTIWLVPGLFGRQLGELESFLPPESNSSVSPPAASPASYANLQREADWILNDYDGALQKAKQENKLLFVDFTGYTCTNCRWMEANMFPRPEVSKEMDGFVRVRLYTDGAGEVFERQQKMQQEKFGTVALPYYAILRADGSPVNVFPGLTRNANEFLAFLQKGSAL